MISDKIRSGSKEGHLLNSKAYLNSLKEENQKLQSDIKGLISKGQGMTISLSEPVIQNAGYNTSESNTEIKHSASTLRHQPKQTGSNFGNERSRSPNLAQESRGQDTKGSRFNRRIIPISVVEDELAVSHKTLDTRSENHTYDNPRTKEGPFQKNPIEQFYSSSAQGYNEIESRLESEIRRSNALMEELKEKNYQITQ